jgi:hypothetical protein
MHNDAGPPASQDCQEEAKGDREKHPHFRGGGETLDRRTGSKDAVRKGTTEPRCERLEVNLSYIEDAYECEKTVEKKEYMNAPFRGRHKMEHQSINVKHNGGFIVHNVSIWQFALINHPSYVSEGAFISVQRNAYSGEPHSHIDNHDDGKQRSHLPAGKSLARTHSSPMPTTMVLVGWKRIRRGHACTVGVFKILQNRYPEKLY